MIVSNIHICIHCFCQRGQTTMKNSDLCDTCASAGSGSKTVGLDRKTRCWRNAMLSTTLMGRMYPDGQFVFFCAATWMCSSMNMMKGLFFHQFGDQKQRCKMVDVCRKRSPKLQSTLKLIWYPSGTGMLSTCCSWVVWLNPIPQAYPILIR